MALALALAVIFQSLKIFFGIITVDFFPRVIFGIEATAIQIIIVKKEKINNLEMPYAIIN